MKFVIWLFFEKSFRTVQISLKSDKNNWYFTGRPIYVLITSHSVLLRIRNDPDKSCRKNQSTHFMFSFESFAVCGIMWKNIVDLGRPQMTIWHMLFACWIPVYKHTLRICNTYCFSTATLLTQMHLSVTLQVHCLSCFVIGKNKFLFSC